MNQLIIMALAAVIVLGGGAWLVMSGNLKAAIDVFVAYGPEIITVGQLLGLVWAGMTGNIRLIVILMITLCGTLFWGWN